MRQIRVLLTILAVLAVFPLTALAGDGFWTFQVGTGDAYSFPSRLTIRQDGYEDIELTARYETKAFETQAIYYNFKIGYWEDGSAWEFESLHHKLYLKNKPEEVEEFHISHGYNINTVNYAWEWGWFIWRVGGGIVMAHPETTVRGHHKEDDGGWSGFYISGLAVQGAIEKRWYFWRDLFISLEAKFTAADAVVPIYGGEADVTNFALHGIASLGYKF